MSAIKLSAITLVSAVVSYSALAAALPDTYTLSGALSLSKSIASVPRADGAVAKPAKPVVSVPAHKTGRPQKKVVSYTASGFSDLAAHSVDLPRISDAKTQRTQEASRNPIPSASYFAVRFSGSRSEAQSLVARMKASGDDSLFVVSNDDGGVNVWLGAYRDRAVALKRQHSVSKLFSVALSVVAVDRDA